jgi:hypothetical protein
MLRRSFRFFCEASRKESNTVSLHASPLETPFLLEAEREKKPFIDPNSLRAFIASFLVGSFGIASMYWLMSHRVSTEAMHRRRFIQSMTGTNDEDYDKDSGRLIRRRGVGLLFGDGKDQPFEQFVSPSCQSYRELVEQVEEAERIIALENEVNSNTTKNNVVVVVDDKNNNSSGQRITISLPKKPSSMFSDAIHASTLHETAMDHLKQTWNDSVENVQDALRSMMSAWVDMRERDTIAAVNEMARSALGEDAVVVRRK